LGTFAALFGIAVDVAPAPSGNERVRFKDIRLKPMLRTREAPLFPRENQK
jgi:hypothetical protein